MAAVGPGRSLSSGRPEAGPVGRDDEGVVTDIGIAAGGPGLTVGGLRPRLGHQHGNARGTP